MTERIAAAVAALGERGLGVEGVHVHQHRRAPVEQHWAADIRRDVFSAAKTVTSLAIGIAEAEGLLGLDDPVLVHLDGLTSAPASGLAGVTIRQLLTMTSGIVFRWTDPDADHPGDPAREILESPLGVPGEFAYRGANTYLLSRIVLACSGVDLRDFLVPRLFGPLGIGNPQWLRCPLGHPLGAAGLLLRTEELARVGRLLLDGGSWAGHRLVPASYVDGLVADAVPTGEHVATGASAPHPENARYGRGVWLCTRDSAWRMDGIYGQFGIVLPEHRACVTVTAHYRGPTSDILDAVWATVVPTLTSAA